MHLLATVSQSRSLLDRTVKRLCVECSVYCTVRCFMNAVWPFLVTFNTLEQFYDCRLSH